MLIDVGDGNDARSAASNEGSSEVEDYCDDSCYSLDRTNFSMTTKRKNKPMLLADPRREWLTPQKSIFQVILRNLGG